MGIADSLSVIDAWNEVDMPSPPPIHAVSIDPKRSALLLLDFLRDVCTERRPRAAAALPKIEKFLTKARSRGMVVVHTTTRKGLDDGSDLAEPIKPIPGERVYKAPFNKFHDNDLDQFLKNQGVQTLVLAGTSPNGCLLFTVAGAVLNGYRAIVPIDGMPAATLYQEQFVAWEFANGPGFRETTVLSAFDAISFDAEHRNGNGTLESGR
jgi:nicotinamidase-related amidase